MKIPSIVTDHLTPDTEHLDEDVFKAFSVGDDLEVFFNGDRMNYVTINKDGSVVLQDHDDEEYSTTTTLSKLENIEVYQIVRTQLK